MDKQEVNNSFNVLILLRNAKQEKTKLKKPHLIKMVEVKTFTGLINHFTKTYT